MIAAFLFPAVSDKPAMETATGPGAAEVAAADSAAGASAADPSKATFELYQDRGNEWRWRLRHRNGNVIADGGEGYTSKQNAKKGIAAVQRTASRADVVEQ